MWLNPYWRTREREREERGQYLPWSRLRDVSDVSCASFVSFVSFVSDVSDVSLSDWLPPSYLGPLVGCELSAGFAHEVDSRADLVPRGGLDRKLDYPVLPLVAARVLRHPGGGEGARPVVRDDGEACLATGVVGGEAARGAAEVGGADEARRADVRRHALELPRKHVRRPGVHGRPVDLAELPRALGPELPQELVEVQLGDVAALERKRRRGGGGDLGEGFGSIFRALVLVCCCCCLVC